MTRHQELERRLAAFLHAHPAPSDNRSFQVHSVLRRVHDGLFDSRLNVNAIKASCHIADNNVSCRFKHEVGVSIKEYIELLRLAAARTLLQDGRFSVAEVAQSVGYVHLQTFYAAFSRHFASSPGEARNNEWVPLAASSDHVA